MSHITDVRLVIKDLDGAREAALACGGVLHEGVTQYKNYYGTKPCSHVIRFPDSRWEVGLLAQPDGSFQPQLDVWGSEGAALTSRLGGQNCEKFKREYAVAVATKQANRTLGRQGFRVQREDLPNGRVRLKVRKR